MNMGCFLIGVTGKTYTTNGEALLGSISDDPYDIRTFVRSKHPKGRIAHVGTELIATKPPSFVERGFFCREGDTSRGVNAAGLAFTCAMLFENKTLAKKTSQVSFSLLSKQIMEQCHNVREAIDLIDKAGAVDPPFSILLADSTSTIAHVEAGRFGVEVLHEYNKERPGAIFAVNCYQSKRKIKYNDPAAGVENSINNNGARLQRGYELCERWKGKLDIDKIAQILSDHANRERDPITNPLLEAWGFSICNHGTRQNNDRNNQQFPWGTVSAEILQPLSNILFYCYGWPCGEKPEFKDQLYQENSWGVFHPFTIAKDVLPNQKKILTTVKGKLLTIFS
jgi:Acyl-coenzyme A:6-aminopenicillanic acid acyl-transferase